MHINIFTRRLSYGALSALFLSICFLSAPSGNAQPGAIRTRPHTRPPANATASGQSTVKGRVVYKDNGQPLKASRVRIVPREDSAGNVLVAFANARGEFRVDNLAAGKYYVTVEGPGMAMQSGLGMRIPLPLSAIPTAEDFPEITPKHDAVFSVDGTNTVEVEVRVARGGTISGKILKANGEPAGNASVSFLSREDANRPYMARFSAQADKTGAYKIENIPVGAYIVAAASEDKRPGLDIRARLRGESQVFTYHPAAISTREAISVRVDPGREVGGVNITIVARNAFAVSGTLVRQLDGTPIGGATVSLRNRESEFSGSLVPGMGQRTTRTDADGSWVFSNVMEGAYVVTALAPRSQPERTPGEEPDREQLFRESRQRFLITQQEVLVAGADVAGLSMAISGPGSIVGRVETDDGSPLPPNQVIFLEVLGNGIRPGPPLPVRLKSDGTFELNGIQGGDVYFAVALAPNSKSFVKSVSADGNDLRRTPLKVIEGAQAGPVEVVISEGVGSLTGRLSAVANQALTDFVVLLAPVELEKQRFRTSYPSTRTAPDGTFSLAGPPGEYFVFARRRDELPPIVSQDFVNSAAANVQRVTLKRGGQTRLDLRVP